MSSFRFPSHNQFRRIVESSNPVESFRGASPPGRASTFLRCSGSRKIEKFTLPKLNSSPMKNDGWKLKDDPFRLWVSVFFQFGERFVPLFRGGNFAAKKFLPPAKWWPLEDEFGGSQLFRGAEVLRVLVIGWDARMAGGRMASLETTLEKVLITKLKILPFFLDAKNKLPENILVTW